MILYKQLNNKDPEVVRLIKREIKRQEEEINLIASENYVSPAVLAAMSSVFTNKYSEGYSGKRYYGGNVVVDDLENLAIKRLKKLFKAEHANVQPFSGSSANAAVYMAFLQPGDKVLGLKLDHGGHLSHGHPANFSGKLYNFIQYELDANGLIDMEQVREIAQREKPKMIVAGFSAYSRELDWKKFKEIADEVSAYTFADISHIAGLIAGGVLSSPVPYFDVVSATTHKTLRGPRGAFILCKKEFAQQVDRAVFPGIQGGPHNHINAAKALAFKEALEPKFKKYCQQVIKNAQVMANRLMSLGYKIISSGTDNHLMVIDLRNKGINGLAAEQILEKISISVSRSTIPNDPAPAMKPSGIRIGSAAISTRGFKKAEVLLICDLINEAFLNKDNEIELLKLKKKVKNLCQRFPIYK